MKSTRKEQAQNIHDESKYKERASYLLISSATGRPTHEGRFLLTYCREAGYSARNGQGQAQQQYLRPGGVTTAYFGLAQMKSRALPS